MEQQKKRNPWTIVNVLVFLLHLVLPLWIGALMLTPGISGLLFPVMLICGFLPGVCSMCIKRFQRGRGLLIASRVLALCAIAAFYTPMFLIRGATKTRWLYSAKRFLYTYGVYGADGCGYYQALLPERLPDPSTGYRFRTKGRLIAQDYHASSFLTFYTDTAALDAYAAYYDGMDCERIQYNPKGKTEEEQFPNLSWFCGQMRLDQSVSEDPEHMVLYWFDDHYPKGVLLDYETGLVAVLT